jgi:AcrR family transcriptional regulator
LESGRRILELADRLFYAEGVRATGTEKIMSHNMRTGPK